MSRGLHSQLTRLKSLRALWEVLREPSEYWNARCLTIAWHRCAKLHDEGLCKKDDPTTAERCVALLVAQHRFYRREAKEDTFDAKGLAGIIWAWSKLRVKEKDLLADLCESIPGRLLHFSTKDVSNLVYGFALLRHRTHLVPALCDLLAQRMEEANSQTVANVIYALCLFNMKHRNFLTALGEQIPDRVGEFRAQELSILVYSLALLRMRPAPLEPLLEAVCQEARGRLEEFSPQNISNLVYGVGLLNFKNELFLHDICTFSSRISHTAQGISNMTYALGLLSYLHVNFLRSVRRSIQNLPVEDPLLPQHLGNMSYALGQLQGPPAVIRCTMPLVAPKRFPAISCEQKKSGGA